MRTLFFIMAIIISLSSFTQKGALTVKNSSIDIGTLKEGKIVIINFEIENKTTVPYKIYSVTSTCGCTIPKYPKEIGPRQKILISATFDSKGFHGPVKKELVMVTNDYLKYYKMQFFAKVTK